MKKENRCLFMLKGICCILVILFHCPIPGVFGDAIIYALRFPVPIFFLISGYYSFSSCNYRRNAQKTLLFLFKSEMLAFTISLFLFLTGLTTSNPFSVFRHITLNTFLFGSFFNSTLWYLYAMFWTWILFFFIAKCKNGFHRIYWVSIPLLLVHVIGRYFISMHFDINNYVFLFRSSLLFAFPFLLIGRYIAENYNLFQSPHIFKLSLGTGTVLLIIEYCLWHQYMDFHISTFFISLGLFLFALQNPSYAPFRWLTHIGKRISKYVYISHMPIKLLLSSIMIYLGFDPAPRLLLCLLTILMTLLMSYLFIALKNIFLNKSMQKCQK